MKNKQINWTLVWWDWKTPASLNFSEIEIGMSHNTCWGWKETKATLYACKNQLQRLNCLGPCFIQRRVAWGRGEGTFPSRIHLPRMAGRKNGHVGDWAGEDGKKHLESQRILTMLLQGTRNSPVPPTPEGELPGFPVVRWHTGMGRRWYLELRCLHHWQGIEQKKFTFPYLFFNHF